MGNFGSPYPSAPGLSRPPVVPIKGAIPRPTCWHLTLYDVTNRDDEGYVFATLTDPDEVGSRVRGRANTLRREGYQVEPVGAGAYMCVKPAGAYPLGAEDRRPSEVYLVMAVSCYCRPK